MIVVGLRETKLGEDAVDMLGDCSLGDPQTAGDPGIGSALGHQREHFAFARRQLIERIVDPPRRDKLLNERRVNDRPASDDVLEGLEEVVHVRDATFQ